MKEKYSVSSVFLLFAILLASFSANSQTPTPLPNAAKSKQTLENLQNQLRERTSRQEFHRGMIGAKVVSLKTGKVVYEENAEKYFMPASNMKNFSVAAALEKLTPDFNFTTTIYTAMMPDANGAIRGPIRVFGRGDISMSYSFYGDDRYKAIDQIANAIKAAGVKKIDGDIIGDETYFKGSPIPEGWEWDDLQFYYGTEVSALPINDNAISLTVKPGPEGYSCIVKTVPEHLIVQIKNSCITTSTGTERTLRIHKQLDRNVVEISGELPLGNNGYDGSVAISRPAEMFVAMLKQRLEQIGIEVTGRAFPVNDPKLIPKDLTIELANLKSPPLEIIAAKTMKPSQNMYTEVLLWTLGENMRPSMSITGEDRRTSAQLGREVIQSFLKEIGAPENGLLQSDGSGLSRSNLVTPSTIVHLYTYMRKNSKFSKSWWDSLTIGGIDGTLRNRFRNTSAANNVRGKTGTIRQVSALSGYLKTAAGEELVFSMLVNGIPLTAQRVSLIDEMTVLLTDFDGAID